ncbi:MAG: hypothetical protein JSV18_08070 [Candidatus Bathyarchaeota archaeon]|nr:MAG: hypothetical protein JSV18_08070 [Candidatus Bathyarchaeota archaeon]
MREYISFLVSQGRNSWDRLSALARYSYVVGRNNFYIYFTSILGGRSVLPSISERLATIAGEEAKDRIFEGVEPPPLGSPPERFPTVTQLLMERLEANLSPDACRRVLAGNHHRVPVEGFKEQREMFLKAGSIDEFLKELHNRAVAELERYMSEGRIWYEQEITPRVVEFVRGNQEVLAGVRRDDRIYMTKIPYDPDDYLRETDPLKKRYYMCHCPLARASILEGKPEISPTWCYCSGGYEKLLFDMAFDEEVCVEVLESAIAGNPRCRFAVEIPEGKFK